MSVTINSKGESTVVVTLRVDSKLHYGLQLLARKQRRSLNSTMEWAIERLIYDHSDGLVEPSRDGKSPTKRLLEELWDVDEADRVAKLAQRFPELLSHDEQRLWKVIKENPKLWVRADVPDVRKIRDQWATLKREAVPQKRKEKS